MNKKVSTLDYLKSSRGSWGCINPVTKVIPDKTRYSRKRKHKNKNFDF